MKYILSSYGVNNPYLVADIPDHAVYPIGIEGDDFVDLDYSSLLLGEGFIFDSTSFEYLQEQVARIPFIQPVIHSIERLRAEGLLEMVNVAEIVAQNLDSILSKTEALCEDIPGWLGPVRSQWKFLKSDRDNFLEKFGTNEKREINSHHFSVINAVTKIDGKLNSKLLNEISGLVESRRTTFGKLEKELIKEVIRPLVCHTVIQDLVRYKTSGSILDWDDSQPYYQRLYQSRWDEDVERQLAAGAQNLFEFSLPELRPKNVDGLIKFIRDDRNVSALRADIVGILDNGEKIDQSLGRKIVEEILNSELSNRKKLKKFRFLGAAVSLFVPGGSLLTEAAVEAVTMIAEDEAAGLLTKNHRWFYSLRE